MAESIHLFVDNSNVLIEARRFWSMKKRGRDRPDELVNNSYEIDWGKFVDVVKSKGNRLLAQSPILYGSRPPPDDTIWERIRKEGFDTKIFERNIRDKEKGVDMEMGLDVMERIATVTPPTRLVIAAGDGDYLPVIKRAQKKGWGVELWFWSNAAVNMQTAATEFNPLDRYLDYLRFGGGVAFPP